MLLGADPDKLDELARQFDSAVAGLQKVYRVGRQAAHSSAWSGPDAQQFRQQWDGPSRSRIQAAERLLASAASTLRQNAEAQRQTSEGGSGSFGGVVGGFGSQGGHLDGSAASGVGRQPAAEQWQVWPPRPNWASFIDQGIGAGLWAGGLLSVGGSIPAFLYDGAHWIDHAYRNEWGEVAWDTGSLALDSVGPVTASVVGAGAAAGGATATAAAAAGASAAAALAVPLALTAVLVDDIHHYGDLSASLDRSYQQAGDAETLAYMQRYHSTNVGPAPGHEAEYFAIAAQQSGRVGAEAFRSAFASDSNLTFAGRLTMVPEAVFTAELGTAWAGAQSVGSASVEASKAVSRGFTSAWRGVSSLF